RLLNGRVFASADASGRDSMVFLVSPFKAMIGGSVPILCPQVHRRGRLKCAELDPGTRRCAAQASAAGRPVRSYQPMDRSAIMEPVSTGGLPADVLIVEDDPLLRLDLEDTILRLGVKSVRSAANAALALQLIADREPSLALLDVGLFEEKSFAVAERLASLGIPFVFITGYAAG